MPSARISTLLSWFSANVQRYRLEAGLTQAALAERAELDLRHLQKIESGQFYPNLKTFLVLVDALGKSPEALFVVAERQPLPRGRPRKRPAATRPRTVRKRTPQDG